MSEHAPSSAGAGPGGGLVPGDVLVVRTLRGWNLTLAERRQPTPVSDAAVHALVRASGGARLAEDDPGRRELVEIGVALPGGDGALAGRVGEAPRGDTSPASTLEWVPVHPDTPVQPLPVFVGLVRAGSLLVEGHGGRRELLDDVDLLLIESMAPDTTAGEVVAMARAALGTAGPADDELSGRLRRLGEVGRAILYIDDRRGLVPASELPEPPAPPEPEIVSLGLTAELRRLSFPGRAYAAKGYRGLRRVRRALRARTGPAAPTSESSPSVAAPVGAGAEVVVPDPAPDEVTADEVAADEVAADEVAADDVAADAPAFDAPGQVTYLDAPDLTAAPEGAVPVYSVFPVETGPPLSLGMLLANARAWNDGALNRTLELRRMEDPASFFADLATREGPAVLLLSNYVWSLDHNLEVARRAKAINPATVVVHGGPSTPKYEGQCEEWFAEYAGIVDVAVRNEGEVTITEALAALVDGDGGVDLGRLEGVAGLTFRHPADGRIVRTEERERVTSLDDLPSPYLTGEFDHIDPSAWTEVTIETTRGCPYGCTFCDWGSSTLSRIRKFDIERVAAEMHWAGEREFDAWAMGDANFGIMSRDVDVTRRVVEVKQRWGYPKFFGFNVAKNTTKHLTVIVDELVKAGIGPMFTLALQTRDEETLEAVRRTNISTEHYTSLASSLRRRGLPLRADIMLGLPGQTVDSLSGDLQFLMDHDVPARMWITQLLPNAPINDPAYREEWDVVDDHGVVIATRSFTAEDRAEMLRIRHAYTVFEQFGLLRHVTRHVQWDHGVDIMTVLRRIVTVSDHDPDRYPLLNWTMRYFDYFNAPPVGWRSFYEEVRRFLVAEFGLPVTEALDTVLEVQELLMPEMGRTFPASIALRHDYVRYYQDRTRPLWMSEPAATSGPALTEYGPARFTVYADPLSRCSTGTINVITDPRNESMTDDFWMYGHWEMDSPLVVNQPQVAGSQRFIGLLEQVPDDLPDEPEPASRSSVRISVGRSSGDADDDEPPPTE